MPMMRAMFAGALAAAALAALTAAPARAADSCVDLRLGGKKVLDIPCPEGLDRILESLPIRPTRKEKRDFAITPDVPDDHDMEIVPEWPPMRSGPARPEEI